MTISILATVATSTAVQVVLFLIVVRVHGVSPYFTRLFFIVTGGSHLALVGFLLVRRSDFYIIPDGLPLRRINLANVLSVSRVSSTPTILFLLVLSRDHDLAVFTIVFTSIVFFTDLLDGWISRRGNQVTRIGAYLDSISDYAILVAVSIAFDYYGLISRWFFVLIMFRLLLQFAGMAALLLYHGRADARATLWGKLLVSATMVLYAGSLLELFESTRNAAEHVTWLLEYAVAVVVIISTVEKAVLLVRAFHPAREDQDSA